ncbi:MAG: hypothetical protein Q8N94_07885 [Methanoregula sp.]|nr:hypothetical protein [Methanoregula sp.]
MNDLRQQVVDSRGLLKKIELSIPGFRGYRLREDIRDADNLLRTYLADQLDSGVQKKLIRAREIFSKSLELDLLNDIGELINMNKGLVAKIRHAEHGYSGISPQYRVDENELNQMYDFDNNLIEFIRMLQSKSELLVDQTGKKEISDIKTSFNDIRTEIEMVDELLSKRRFQLKGIIDRNTGA